MKTGKLLGIMKLNSSKSKAQAGASYDMLNMWQLENSVRVLVFDTTLSNSEW